MKVYAALINTEHEYWSQYSTSTKESIAAINLLGMIQIRPLLLAILGNFESTHASDCIKKLVSVAVRFQIVGGVGGGTLERVYSETAKGVSEKKLTSTKQVIDSFTTLPSDLQFMKAFSTASISKQSLARYYLRELERVVSTTIKKDEKTTSSDTTKVNLEHILPITPSNEWTTSWTQEDIRVYQKRLGNLTLMKSKANSQSGNDAFSTKKIEYGKSDIAITREISKYTVWDKTAIETRQEAMAKLAVKAWAV